MNIKSKLVRGAAGFFRSSGLSKIVGSRYGGNGTIFSLHSVVPDPSEYLFESDRVSTRFLEAFLLWLREKNIDIVTLNEALRRLQADDPRRFAVITCDDGYADNFVHMLPIMEKFNAPFTVHVTTHWITREFSYWSGGLVRLFRERDVVEIEPMNGRFVCSSLHQKVAGFQRALNWCYRECPDPGSALETVFRKYGIRPEAVLDEDALSEEQLKEFATSPLVTIGGHTTTHPILCSLPEEQALADIRDNRAFLESIIQKPVEHLSYPFGRPKACCEREEKIAAEAGFKTATTTRKGNLFRKHLDRPHALPRATIRGDLESIGLMDLQMSGVPTFFRTRGGDPFVTM